mmetsp:Transcript_110342/g.213680  ORF Transcript_110342/g.213680 Transcript_110342/m.213680 type:complete len:81 (+) Transcript_110342:701-943(+)
MHPLSLQQQQQHKPAAATATTATIASIADCVPLHSVGGWPKFPPMASDAAPRPHNVHHKRRSNGFARCASALHSLLKSSL